MVVGPGTKRQIAVLISLAALLFVASSLHATGQAAKPESAIVWVHHYIGCTTPEGDEKWMAALYKISGVHVKIIKPAVSEYNTKIAAMLAAGDQVDLVYLDWTTYDDLVRNNPGMFEMLDGRIKSSKIFSDKSKFPDKLWEYIRKDDGHIYGTEPLGGGWMATGTLSTVRWDWVVKLGLASKFEGNEKITLDDYYQLLRAFTYNDPDGNGKQDTYGLALGDTFYESQPFFGSVGALTGYAKDKAGKVYVPIAQPEAKPVWEFLRRLVVEKILEPNYVTNGSGAFRELFMTGKVGMINYWTNWVNRFTDTVKASDPASLFRARAINPPIGPSGVGLLRTGRPAFNAIPTVSKNKDLAFKVLEAMQTEQGSLLGVAGTEGYDYNMVNGKAVFTEQGKKDAQNHGHAPSWNWTPPWDISPDLKEAVAICLKTVKPQDFFGRSGDEWDQINMPIAAKMMQGDITVDAGLAEMRKAYKDAGLTDY